MDSRAKLLKKYIGEVKVKKEKVRASSGVRIKDNERDFADSVSSSSQDLSQPNQPRIHSDSEGEQPIQQAQKSKRVSKGIRKAFGLKRDEDASQFLDAVKIEGVGMNQLEHYLKNNKEGLRAEGKAEGKRRKQAEKQVKLEVQSESSSDLDIPQQSRTIYRNKDGSIREFSQAQAQKMKQQQVLQRLGEWEKGMVDPQDNKKLEELPGSDIWDDPARRWAAPIRKPFKCAYQGYANRFGIAPGFRWDGVIRGNGFQTKYLQEQNLKKARESRQQREYLKNL